ncbi:MAG: hypothetical protein F4204_10610 [Rhodospirillaceae bacterium]|nr:hypothetical protein [Rhodospirillaceae bacterium]MYH35276.1 hypothetical protein [Rhodospirillaceae bacterium]MYK60274.1 hypothetical protein [Rhodospirillaceae bacterium]
MLFLLFWQLLSAPLGHSGFDALSVGGWRILGLILSSTTCITATSNAITARGCAAPVEMTGSEERRAFLRRRILCYFKLSHY